MGIKHGSWPWNAACPARPKAPAAAKPRKGSSTGSAAHFGTGARTCWGQISRRIKDKATMASENNPVAVIDVDPKNTSISCRKCSHTGKDNRKSQAVFHCTRCGHTDHADTNAAAGRAVNARISHHPVPRQTRKNGVAAFKNPPDSSMGSTSRKIRTPATRTVTNKNPATTLRPVIHWPETSPNWLTRISRTLASTPHPISRNRTPTAVSSGADGGQGAVKTVVVFRSRLPGNDGDKFLTHGDLRKDWIWQPCNPRFSRSRTAVSPKIQPGELGDRIK